MDGEQILTPAEIAAGMTLERKRAEREATGFRDVEAIKANKRAHASTAGAIIGSARKFGRALRWRGKVD